MFTRASLEFLDDLAANNNRAWFEENKARYAAPEYRKITYVKLQNQDIADPAAINAAASE